MFFRLAIPALWACMVLVLTAGPRRGPDLTAASGAAVLIATLELWILPKLLATPRSRGRRQAVVVAAYWAASVVLAAVLVGSNALRR